MNRYFIRTFEQGFYVGLATANREAAMKEGILQKLKTTSICHGDTLTSADTHGEESTVNLEPVGSKYALDASKLVSGSISSFRQMVMEARTKLRQELAKSFYTRMSEAAEQAGNVVQVTEKELTKEGLLEVIRRIEVSFDKNGHPILPGFALHPDREAQLKRLLEDKYVMWSIENIMWEKTLKRYAI